MLDFLRVEHKVVKKGDNPRVEVRPEFLIKKSQDLMVRGGDFYAVWVEERGLWSTDEDDLISLVDAALYSYSQDQKKNDEAFRLYPVHIFYMRYSSTGSIDRWHKYCQKQCRDNFHMLDESIIFSNTDIKKDDYATKRLPYSLIPGSTDAWDTLVSTLYSAEERHKIEWVIGAIVTGDSRDLQKFMVLYGAAGTGKSTIINIIQKLFDGYYSVFDAKALGNSNSQFALEAFKANPLVAIQHDGDLSRIEDNTRLNSLVSHELMTVNEKFKSTYSNRFRCFLIMGTNKPVRITDAKSGLLRRLIDVTPTGKKLSLSEYNRTVKKIDFELGAIADHCKNVYLEDPAYYDDYIPTSMLGASNDFYNFVIDSYSVFLKEDGTTLKAAWEMYKTYCDEAKVPYPYSKRNFKEELKNYFWDFEERFKGEDGSRLRSYYKGFRTDKFESDKKEAKEENDESVSWLELEDGAESIFDAECNDCPAQYASSAETPKKPWSEVKTTLNDIDTSKLHYVKVPENHIVIDFDIKNEKGEKSYDLNLAAASNWPPTYAELSKGGSGIHLHYIYTGGDPARLSRIYDDSIEVKVFTGNSSLRRRLSKCNNLPIATINAGLPLKGENKMIDKEIVQTEKGIRTLIKRNLNKEIHPGTKPSIDFIFKILDDAYKAGTHYDVSDLENAVVAFAAQSTHHADYCIKRVNEMHFKSDDRGEAVNNGEPAIVFFDCEVFPNYFTVCWKTEGDGTPVVKMINPTPSDIEELLKFRLVGFNNRRYDNHILYARLMGYTNEELYHLSQKIISGVKGDRNVFFSEAYNVSHTDIYDFAAKKQSLKKWEIELGSGKKKGIRHQELGLPWDQPVPEELRDKVADYCANDVIATEAVFNHLKGDFTARQILADLAGGTVNDTTNSLTTKIIFGKERHPELVYTHLEETFPGYEFKDGKNMYRGTDLGFGGYVYSEPGMYGNVALLDVASLHPHSIIAMNTFGEYTKNFKDILDARMHIKHGEFDAARHMLGGKLAPYLDDESTAKDLAQALKIAINSVYGLTAANFDNPFRDIRNKNNIVALRGALFMRTLQDEVQQRGFKVIHIKTDSIKIPDATPEIIKFCMDFANKYGYTFEHEATYARMCLVNNADYIAKYKDGKHAGEWTATGKQFAVPYVFKTLFSHEDICLNDLCETFSVQKGALYLDMNEKLPDVTELEKQMKKYEDYYKKGKLSDTDFEKLCHEIADDIAAGHDYHFIGRVGQFTPIKPGYGGGVLYRVNDGKYYAAAGSTGYRWLESELFYSGALSQTVTTIDPETGEPVESPKLAVIAGNSDAIDRSFYDKLASDAVDAISKYGDFEWFVSDDPYISPPRDDFMNIPEGSPEEVPFDDDDELPWD